MKTKRILYKIILLTVLVVPGRSAICQQSNANEKLTEIDPRPFADNTNHWYNISDKSNMINPMPGQERYKPDELTAIADNMLLFQKSNGGWPKNYDFFAKLTDAQKNGVASQREVLHTTFDNGNTYTQINALAIAYTATGIEKYKQSVLSGLDYVLKAQYKNGGWPQYYPYEGQEYYSREITFNDGVFEGIMAMLKDILDNKPQYTFIDAKYRETLKAAYDKGLDCILKTQINDTGKPTVWCQQHDHVTLQPAWARKFEPPSICNGESSDVVLFLMSIDHPSKQIVDAIQNAVAWFQESKIYNTRVNVIPAPRVVTPYKVSTTDRVVVTDTTAPPIWTRYYELKTHRPLFCNRDSKVVYTLAEVTRERRDGYGWYTYAPQKVLDKYPQWQKHWVPDTNILDEK